LGGAGAIAACAHLCTTQFVQVIQLLGQGELERARALWQPLAPLVSAVFAEPNPAVIKAVLAQQGFIQNGLRLPMVAASAGATQHLLAILDLVAQV
jgi:4-hydroxy-tetrahydrodipicolinate synthase